MLIQVDVKRDDQELYLQSTVNHLSAERPVLRAVNLHLGPAGQIVKLRLILRTPEQEVTATGRVKDDQIEFEFTEGKQVNVQTFPWSDLSVPGNVVLFVLPCFPELLPKEGWSFVQFDEQGLASGPRTIRAEQTPDGTRVRVTHTDSGALQTEAVLNQNGRLISLLRGEQRIVEVTAHEAQRLTEEARARREAFERHQRAHPTQDPPRPTRPRHPKTPSPTRPRLPRTPRRRVREPRPHPRAA